VAEAFELEGRPVYAALDVAAWHRAGSAVSVRRAAALPRFPAATRDLAVVVAEALPAGEVQQVLHEGAGAMVESVRLFDIYRGAPVPDDHKSLAFHVVYRDPKGTLTDKLVDEAHARLTQIAEQRFGASVRK
jgi:phenylalanyl-tRNA synthetase beta chain